MSGKMHTTLGKSGSQILLPNPPPQFTDHFWMGPCLQGLGSFIGKLDNVSETNSTALNRMTKILYLDIVINVLNC